MASDIINLTIIILLLMHSICARPRNKKSLRWSSPPSKNSILISISADFFLPHVQRLLITEHCFTSLRQPTASRGKSGKFHFVRRKNDFMLKLIIIRNRSGRRRKNTKIREKQILCNCGEKSLAERNRLKSSIRFWERNEIMISAWWLRMANCDGFGAFRSQFT